MIRPSLKKNNPSTTDSTPLRQSKKRGVILTVGLAAVLLIISIVVSSLLPERIKQYRLYQANQEAIQQQQLSYQKAQETISAVATLIELPDEEPTVATIYDLSKLQGQPFFARAEEGDQVLFFTQAQKAILYRPTANKIIEVSALELENK